MNNDRFYPEPPGNPSAVFFFVFTQKGAELPSTAIRKAVKCNGRIAFCVKSHGSSKVSHRHRPARTGRYLVEDKMKAPFQRIPHGKRNCAISAADGIDLDIVSGSIRKYSEPEGGKCGFLLSF